MAGWDCPGPPARWAQASQPPFVGRQHESAALREAWALASRGIRQAVFVGGEPGVGKSRLVAEAATELSAQGAAVLLGTCVSALGAPYQPFVGPLTVVADAIADGSLSVAGPGRPDVSGDRYLESLRILAGLARPSMHQGMPDTGDHQFARQLFEACAEVVVAAAAARPVVLVLEDVHWAGDGALQLLHHLVARTTDSAVLIIATQRTGAPDRSAGLVATVAQLYRLDGVHRIDLDGLSTDEITNYLGDLAGSKGRRVRGAAAMLRDLTGGNPFLIREVWRDLSGRGGLAVLAHLDPQAPESLRHTVSQRLSGLPPEHRRTVEVAAVIGEEFSVPLLATVRAADGRADSPALTFAGLEAAGALGLVEPVRGSDGRYRFPHGLARQAVLELLGDLQEARDNACVAQVLEGMPAADLRVQRLAHHYAKAAALGFADKAVHYLAAAADEAEAALAHGDAARLFERAAGMATEPAVRDELRLRAARGYLRSSRLGRARELNEAVAATATGTDRLRAAIGYEAASWRSGQPGERSVELLTDALHGVALDDHDPLSIRGLAALGRAYAFTAEVDRSRALGEHATHLARGTGDDRLLAAALQIGLQTAVAPDALPEKLARATEVTVLAERIRDLRHLGPAAYHRAAICYVQGDAAGLTAAHNDLARTAKVTGQAFWEWVASCVTFGVHFLRAEFDAALRIATEAEDFGRDFEPGHDAEGASSLQSFMVRRENGGLERVRALISGDERTDANWAPGLLGLYCELRLKGPAQRLLDALLDRDLSMLRVSATWPLVLSLLSEAAVWLADRDAARRLHPLALEYAGLNMMGGEFLAMVGSADRQIGALESLLGISSAASHFATAFEMDARMGSPVHVATTLAAEVAHLHRVGDRSGRADQQHAIAQRLCDQHGLVRVQRLLDEARPEVQSPAAGGLTARETEVLRLLADGSSNRRIAQRLAISENTAANHVRSILMKTGAGNRTQAAMFAAAHGLLDDRSVSGPSARNRLQ